MHFAEGNGNADVGRGRSGTARTSRRTAGEHRQRLMVADEGESRGSPNAVVIDVTPSTGSRSRPRSSGTRAVPAATPRHRAGGGDAEPTDATHRRRRGHNRSKPRPVRWASAGLVRTLFVRRIPRWEWATGTDRQGSGVLPGAPRWFATIRFVLCPELVGRDVLVGGLTRRLDDLAAGRGGGFVALVGEAGAGKSRLLRFVAGAAEARGIVVLSGRASAGGSPSPYRPLRDAFLAAFRDKPVPGRRPSRGSRATWGDCCRR